MPLTLDETKQRDELVSRLAELSSGVPPRVWLSTLTHLAALCVLRFSTDWSHAGRSIIGINQDLQKIVMLNWDHSAKPIDPKFITPIGASHE